MSIARLRQVAALEKGLGPVIEEMRCEAEGKLSEAVCHAAAVAFIIKYGSPKIEEPLARARKRVERSEAWRAHCSATPVLGNCEYEFPRYANDFYVREATRLGIIRFFAGRDERDKLNRIFEKAPPWLIWYTFSDHTARNLGLQLPDLKSVTCFQRFRAAEDSEYDIPKRTFRQELWPRGVVKEPVARPKLLDFDWPNLMSKEKLAAGPQIT